MVGNAVCDMEEDLSGKHENFIKNWYIKLDIKLDMKTCCKVL